MHRRAARRRTADPQADARARSEQTACRLGAAPEIGASFVLADSGVIEVEQQRREMVWRRRLEEKRIIQHAKVDDAITLCGLAYFIHFYPSF